MKAIEASGKTREEAMQNALKELGVELYEVDKIEVLDEGSKGLFGFGARPVKVRLSVEHLEDDRAPARPRAGGAGGGGRGQRPERGADRPQRPERGAQQQGPRGERGPRPERPQGQPQRGGQQRDNRNDRGGDRNRPERPQQGQQQGQPQQQQQQQRSGGQQQGPRGQGQQQPRGPRAERPERPQGQQQPRPQQPRTAPRPAAAAAGADDSDRPKHENVHEEALDALRRAEQFEQFESASAATAADAVEVEAYDDSNAVEAAEAGGEERPDEAFDPITEEQGQEAAAVLREMIAKMGIEAEVTFVHTDDGAAKLDVRSQDSAMLIGRKGRTLGAMQYLVNRMIAQGDTAENTERLMVDVEGYVDRRRESLEDLARHFAGRVKESGRPARLKPLSPQERRIIHMTLRSDPEVRTASLGESLYRTVVISPINARPGRQQGQGQGGGGGRGRGSRGGRGRGGGGGRRPDGPPRQRDAEIDPGQFGD